MNFEILNLVNDKDRDYDIFINNMDSKLMMKFDKNQIIENGDWIKEVLFTVPYIEKALRNPNKNIVTEEEVIKMELVKKVSVESIKHLSKNTNFVTKYDEKTGEVIPEKLLNAYKEENYITYENRFLYSLIKLVEDFITVRNNPKNKEELYKTKSEQTASYEGTTKIRRERIKIKFEYSSKRLDSEEISDDIDLQINELQKKLKVLKTTEMYKLIDSKRVTLVKSPLKMTNVLLKNVNYQYAVKLWNYLNDNFDLENKATQSQKEYEENGLVKKMIDENSLLKYIVFNKINVKSKSRKRNSKNVIRDKEEQKEITDQLIQQLIDVNPEMAEQELKKMITKKYIQYKQTREITLIPIKDKFEKEIEKYCLEIEKKRLK